MPRDGQGEGLGLGRVPVTLGWQMEVEGQIAPAIRLTQSASCLSR